MKLYGAIGSAYTARVILTARCKGIELPVVMPPGEGIAALKSPEYLKLNPFGKIPTLETAQGAIIESTVICEYLDDTAGGAKLMPADAFERARVRMLGQITDHYLLSLWRALAANINPANRDQAQVATTMMALRAAVGQLETFMGEGPFAVGRTLSLGDCLMYPSFVHLVGVLREFFAVSDLLRESPRLARWFEHMNAHPVAGPTGQEQFERFVQFARAAFFK